MSISNPNALLEVSRVTVDKVESAGNYRVNFQGPDLKYLASGPIPANASASEMKNAIASFYSSKFGSDITVNKTMYDVNGISTTNSTAATKHVFHIKLRKLINGVSTA